MFKIVNAELKKMISKPGVYVLAIFLALLLVLGVFVYNPTKTKTTALTLEGKTFSEKYNDFLGDGSSTGIKVEADKLVSNSTYQVSLYLKDLNANDSILFENKTAKAQIDELILSFENNYKNFKEYQYLLDAQKTETNFENNYKQPLINSFNSLITSLKNGKSLYLQKAYVILTTKQNDNDFLEIYTQINSLFNSSKYDDNAYFSVEKICDTFDNNLKSSFTDCLNKFIYPTLDANFVDQFTKEENSKLATVLERLNNIAVSIEELKQQVENDNDLDTDIAVIDSLTDLVIKYYNTANTYKYLVDYELLNVAFNTTSTKQEMDLLGLENYSQYNIQTLTIRYNYLFDNNKTSSDYALPLTIGITSNSNTNAYDYAFYVLEIFAFILIIYAILRTAYTIAGEIKEGTMRYLSIRPVSRTKLLLGKLFSIIIMCTILLIFSTTIALVVGGFVFGYASNNILTVFNSSTAIVLRPLTMLMIALLSIIIKLTIYVCITLLLSCLIKSDLFIVTIMMVLYLLNMLFPLFAGANTWLNFYPMSHINLYALFGNSIYQSNDIISILFGSHIYASTNLVLTSLMIILFTILPVLLAKFVFKRKEL